MDITENDLLGSRALRARVMDREQALDKVKALSLLPDDMHVTTRMVADYFEVREAAIHCMVTDHRAELDANGYQVLTGERLTVFKTVSHIQSRTRTLALFTRRTVLNVAMLLRDSNVARQVRSYLLDTEEAHRDRRSSPPVDNVIHRLTEWLDARIAEEVRRCLTDADPTQPRADERVIALVHDTVRQVMGGAVTPLLNTAAELSGELLRRVTALEDEVERVKRVQREREAAGAMGAVDAMNHFQFENHVAWLCRRDGCTDVVVTGGHGDIGADVVGYTPGGRRLVVQCKHRHPGQAIASGDVQQFIGMAMLDYRADVALYVATCRFTRDALILASRHQVTAVHRGVLETWTRGEKLDALR